MSLSQSLEYKKKNLRINNRANKKSIKCEWSKWQNTVITHPDYMFPWEGVEWRVRAHKRPRQQQVQLGFGRVRESLPPLPKVLEKSEPVSLPWYWAGQETQKSAGEKSSPLTEASQLTTLCFTPSGKSGGKACCRLAPEASPTLWTTTPQSKVSCSKMLPPANTNGDVFTFKNLLFCNRHYKIGDTYCTVYLIPVWKLQLLA